MQFETLIFLFIFGQSVGAYKILVALPCPWRSHYQFGSEIAKALAAEGHEVTVLSPFKQSEPIPNYEELYIELKEQEIISRKFPSIIMNSDHIQTYLNFDSRA